MKLSLNWAMPPEWHFHNLFPAQYDSQMYKIPGRARNTPFRICRALTTHTIFLPPTHADLILSQRAFGFRGFLFFLFFYITWSWKLSSAEYHNLISGNFSFTIYICDNNIWIYGPTMSRFIVNFYFLGSWDNELLCLMFCAINSLFLKRKRMILCFDLSAISHTLKTKGIMDLF